MKQVIPVNKQHTTDSLVRSYQRFQPYKHNNDRQQKWLETEKILVTTTIFSRTGPNLACDNDFIGMAANWLD